MPMEGGARLQVTLKDMARRFTSQSVSAGLYDPELAYIGLVNEEGRPSKNIPSRPFMHTAFEHHRHAWIEVLRVSLKEGKNSKAALQLAGKDMVVSIQQTLDLSPGLFKENAPRTIKKKGFDYPLYETGKMRRSVKFKLGKVEAT